MLLLDKAGEYALYSNTIKFQPMCVFQLIQLVAFCRGIRDMRFETGIGPKST